MLQLRLASLGHRHWEVRIELSPDEPDRNVECLELRQTFSVLDVCIEELRRQLHKGGARILDEEVVTDKRTEELIEMGFLRLEKGVQEFLLLPVQQPAELFGALGDSHRQRIKALGCEERDHLRPKECGGFGIR